MRGALPDVDFTPNAIAEIDSIEAHYIEKGEFNRARKTLQGIFNKIERIAQNPYAYAVETRVRKPNKLVRRAVVHKDYSVIYRIEEQKILIVKVFHNAQNIKKLRNIR